MRSQHRLHHRTPRISFPLAVDAHILRFIRNVFGLTTQPVCCARERSRRRSRQNRRPCIPHVCSTHILARQTGAHQSAVNSNTGTAPAVNISHA